MTIYTVARCCALLPLLCAFLSPSVFARHHSGPKAFVPRKKSSGLASSSSSLKSPPFSALDSNVYSSERYAKSLLLAHASSFLVGAIICRGGYQDYDDDYSKPYGNDDNYNYNDNYPYDDRGSSYDDRGKGDRSGSFFSMPDIIKTGNRKIGLPLLAIGGALTILGASLFFNKTLMRLGNLFFVAGVPVTLGPGRTAGYFFQPKKARATACLAAGVMLVFIGWPIFGIILEGFGLLNLFGNMFPMAMMILKQMPVIGPLLKGNVGNKKNNNDRYGDGGNRYDDYDKYQDDRDPYYNDRGYPDNDDNRYY